MSKRPMTATGAASAPGVPTTLGTSASPERQRVLLDALGTLVRALAGPIGLEELFTLIYEQAGRVLDTTIFVIALYDPQSQTVHVVRQFELGEEHPGGSFPLGGGITSQVIRTGESRLIRQWAHDGQRAQIVYGTDRQALRLPQSGVAVPLRFQGRVLGAFWVQSYDPDRYGEDDLAALQLMASIVAPTIEHLRQSEHLETESRLRISELQTILASMADALVIVDADGRISQLNHAARELLCLGQEHSVILGQPLQPELWQHWPIGAREVAETLGHVANAWKEDQPLREMDVELRGEGRRVLSFSCAPLHAPEGTRAGAVIVFRDVTSRREVERLKDEILSIASHDLKTPITTIKMQVHLLRRRLSSGRLATEDAVTGLTRLEQQVDRLTGLLDLLLDFSRLEAGRFELDPAPTDLVQLVVDMVEAIQPSTERHHLVVHAPPAVKGEWDTPRLEQVLQNLLSNAVKYSPAGGQVEVTVRADEREAMVCVRDQGVGLAADEIPHLFERFYRAKETRRLEGTGLGLYICRGIITAHGGRLWVESSGLGRGSTFCFTLPRHQG